MIDDERRLQVTGRPTFFFFWGGVSDTPIWNFLGTRRSGRKFGRINVLHPRDTYTGKSKRRRSCNTSPIQAVLLDMMYSIRCSIERAGPDRLGGRYHSWPVHPLWPVRSTSIWSSIRFITTLIKNTTKRPAAHAEIMWCDGVGSDASIVTLWDQFVGG